MCGTSHDDSFTLRSLKAQRIIIISLLLSVIVIRHNFYVPSNEDRIALQNDLGSSYEVEWDNRRPNTFKRSDILSVRVPGFKEVNYFDPSTNTNKKQSVKNWEVFAQNYWYETRIKNASCPQLPQGIAAECDWALMIPCMFGNSSEPPKTVFVHTLMLPHFAESVLPFVPNSWRFILISGGHDRTIPNSSSDKRYEALRGFYMRENKQAKSARNWNAIIKSKKIVHWFAENRDVLHPKLSSLPTGILEETPKDTQDFPSQNNILPIEKRALVMLNADRIRQGEQWNERLGVQILCRNSSLCVQPYQITSTASVSIATSVIGGERAPASASASGSGRDNEIGVTRKDYLQLLSQVPFVLCVPGGGLDPSPKAWEAMLVGTIPIIQRSIVSDAYDHLPVAYVDRWQELFQDDERTKRRLQGWIETLGPYYQQGSALRNQTLKRLGGAYWMQQFINELPKTTA